jgi:hypothetical protein
MGTRLPREKEKKVQSAIRVRLWHRFGIKLYRRNVALVRVPNPKTGKDRKFTTEAPGRSDLYGWETRGVNRGRHWEIEVKRPDEEPTPKQLEWLKECHSLGAIAYWSDSANDAERVAEAILQGGKVVWLFGHEYMILMP